MILRDGKEARTIVCTQGEQKGRYGPFGGCEAMIETPAPLAPEAREWAAERGWTFRASSGDRCPDHAHLIYGPRR